MLLARPRVSIGNRAPVWPFGFNRASLQARGLVSWWPAFEGAGPTVRDLARAHHCTIEDPAEVAWAAGPFGAPVLEFSGADGTGTEAFIDAPHHADFDITGDFTLFARVKRASHGSSGDQGGIIAKTNGLSQWDYDFFVSEPGGELAFYADGLSTYTSTGAINDTEPHDVAVARVGSTITFYIDGRPSGTASDGTALNARAHPLQIGSDGPDWSSTEANFHGLIWDPRVMNVGLSAAELWALYDPSTRWDLYRELGVPRAWPAVGGEAIKTAAASLEAAVLAELDLGVSLDSALAAVRAAQANLEAAVQTASQDQVALDAALRAARALSSAVEAALGRTLSVAAALDASLSEEGLGFVAASLDGAVRRLAAVNGALDAALRAAGATTADLDAALALGGTAVAVMEAVVARVAILLGLGLDATLRGTPDLAAALDAAIGTVVLPGRSRTFPVPARGGHAVPGDVRTLVIPAGNRRH